MSKSQRTETDYSSFGVRFRILEFFSPKSFLPKPGVEPTNFEVKHDKRKNVPSKESCQNQAICNKSQPLNLESLHKTAQGHVDIYYG